MTLKIIKKISNSILKRLLKYILLKNNFAKNYNKIKVKGYISKPEVYIKHYLAQIENEKFIIAVGISKLQKKKLKNAVSNENEIEKIYEKYFKFNKVLKYGSFLYFDYAIYKYIENLQVFSNEQDFNYALNCAIKIYNKASYFEINENNVDDFIINNCKIIIPYTDLSFIETKLYQDLKNELLKIKNIKCAAQHGDYNLLNMHKKDNKYLFDLERTMPNMIASYDWYHLLRCKNGWYNQEISNEMREVPYFSIIELFLKIIDEQRNKNINLKTV